MNQIKNFNIKEIFASAVESQKKNNFQAAIDLYNKVLEADPTHINAQINIGILFSNLGNYQKSISCLKKVIEGDFNNYNANYNLGIVYGQLEKNEEAIGYFKKAVEIKNDSFDANYSLGIIYGTLKKNEEAIGYFKKAVEINPKHVDATNNLGIRLYEHSKIFESINCFEKLIKIAPNFTNPYENLAKIYSELGENKKALNYYQKVIEINPDNKNINYNIGFLYSNLSDFTKAMDHYKKQIKINPNHADATNNLGLVYREFKDDQKAIDCFEKAIEIDPRYVNAYNNLGNIHSELGNHQKAINFYKKAIDIDSNFLDLYNNLGVHFKELGENTKALDCYKVIFRKDPNHWSLISALPNLLGELELKKYDSDLKELFLFLFKKNNIDHTQIARNTKSLLFLEKNYAQILQNINLDSTLLTNKIILDLIKEEIFHLTLQKSLIADIFVEKLLTRLRCEILFTYSTLNKDTLREYFDFISSLAEQNWLNEYIYYQSENEIKFVNKLKDKVEKTKEIDELEISILACYMPLNSSDIIKNKLLDYKSSNILFNDLLSLQIKEPLREASLIKSIKSFNQINDPISQKVRMQYEEYPYPRWRYTSKAKANSFFKNLNNETRPNYISYNNKFTTPNVLIAGCGTGRHVISATRYQDAEILGVDLSLSSLSYAKRKTEEFGIKNIDFLHADILQLNKLNKKFDIIECIGTLHHMKDPIAGLKILLELLETHGFLKLGLYSQIARNHLIEIKEFIKSKNLKNTNSDIKLLRQLIIEEKKNLAFKTFISPDFYSTSTIKDLLFHTQEHRFTLPEILKILKDLDLEFVGFHFSNLTTKSRYLSSFPNDKKSISLNNWHQFEIDNPSIFSSMYQFWVKKKIDSSIIF